MRYYLDSAIELLYGNRPMGKDPFYASYYFDYGIVPGIEVVPNYEDLTCYHTMQALYGVQTSTGLPPQL